jgi:hypothetical protein
MAGDRFDEAVGAYAAALGSYGEGNGSEDAVESACESVHEAHASALQAAEQRGREEMREEAATISEEPADWMPTTYQVRLAKRIRALPSTRSDEKSNQKGDDK